MIFEPAIDDELVKTGIQELDEVFSGGVRSQNIMLLEGAPGTGKTTLSLEYIFRGASELNENGVILSFELTPHKILRNACSFGWDFNTLQREGKVRIIYTTPAVILHELQSTDGVLSAEIRKIAVKRIFIDGLTPLKIFGEIVNGRPFRDSLQLLVDNLQRFGVTALLTLEIPQGAAASYGELSHEQFVCDTIITVFQTTNARVVRRFLEIKNL